jgi:phosphatidylglycerophosphate synthase
MMNLFLGLATSVTVVGLAPRMAGGEIPAVAVGLAALLVWQLAYSLDCADGQLARFTRRTSPAGGRVDVLSDVALQISIVAAVAAVTEAYTPETPAWLLAGFAGTWMVNLVTSVLQQGSAAASLVSSASPIVRCVKLIRDYGAVVTFVGLTLAFVPGWTIWLLAVFTLVNGGFLLASVAAAARASLRVP